MIGNDDCEGRAFADPARNRDVAAEQPAEVSRDGKTKAGSAEFLGSRCIGLTEGLKQPTKLLRAHADARIRDRHLNRRSIRTLNRERQFPVLSEFTGIAEDVEEALLHLGAVGAHATDFWCHTKLERVAAFGHQGPYDRSHLFKKGRNVDLLYEYFHLAGFDLGKVEDIIDQPQQMTAGTLDFLEVGYKAALGRRRPRLPEGSRCNQ